MELEGIGIAALPTHAARAWPLFGELDRFGAERTCPWYRNDADKGYIRPQPFRA